MTRKISISLPEDDVEFLDRQVDQGTFVSRSAGLHAALARIRNDGLSAEYQAAFDEWRDSDDAGLWDRTVGDGG